MSPTNYSITRDPTLKQWYCQEMKGFLPIMEIIPPSPAAAATPAKAASSAPPPKAPKAGPSKALKAAAPVAPKAPATPVATQATTPTATLTAAALAPTPVPAITESPAVASAASESDMEIDLSTQTGDDDVFQVVTNRKAKKRLLNSSPQGHIDKEPKQAKTKAASQPRRERLPPPLIIRDKHHWRDILTSLPAHNIVLKEVRDIQHGIKVIVQTPADHRALTRILIDRNSMRSVLMRRPIANNTTNEQTAD
ncbi:hypothetical protein K1T71_014708 [Dendrolimus kikuchii]|nr:hypothetical protein K1T71_014708 [Dendrolimus kikuchii]